MIIQKREVCSSQFMREKWENKSKNEEQNLEVDLCLT